MRFLRSLRWLIPAALLWAHPLLRAATPDEAQREALAHLLAFGRLPTAEESGAAPASGSMAERLEHHRAALRTTAALRAATARRAWLDAFGCAPSEAEARAEASLPLTYAERLQRHVAQLAARPADYREVLRRAYATVVQRDAYPEEFAYWEPHGVRSFVLLVACLEDWARRNQPGLMVTAGVPTVPAHSRRLTILPLSPAIAAEGRAALGWRDTSAAAPDHVLAVGADGLATPADMHLAIVGGE